MNIFPSFYFPPLPWVAAALAQDVLVIEAFSPYRKQTYATRAQIKMADRTLPLTVHAERRSAQCALKDKKISYAEDWPRHHWRSLKTAYQAAPFFEHYAPQLENILLSRPVWLIDLHEECLECLLGWLGTTLNRAYTWCLHPAEGFDRDFRRDFDPSLKSLPDWFRVIPYPQLFDGFVPGLSILDLLLNVGPESRLLLRQSYAAASLGSS